MWMGLFCRGYRALHLRRRRASRLGWLAGVWVTAMGLLLVSGVGQAQAASAVRNAAGSLNFIQPDYRGVIAGPPGTKVTVQGTAWLAYSSVDLSLTNRAKDCNGAVSVGSFPTDKSGNVLAKFNWPAAANQVGAYYACGTQANKGTGYSHNSFNVLSDSPASLSFTPTTVAAGDTITLSGSNWLPAPQTINIVVVPCNGICAQLPVAQLQVVTGDDGTFSQSVTISSGAATNSYYIQGTNSLGVLAASAGPLQVTGLDSSGTPQAGGDPTSVATGTTQGGATVAPLSTIKTALKDALLAGVVGLVVLLVLIGGIAFFLTRSRRGPDLPTHAKDATGMDDQDAWSAEGHFPSRSGPAKSRGGPPPYRQMPQLPPHQHTAHSSLDEEEAEYADAAFSVVHDDDAYAESEAMHPARRPPAGEQQRPFIPPRRPGAAPRTPPPNQDW
jgi:hypothetical protein